MLFNSLIYLLLFLPLTVIFFYSVKNKYAKPVLIVLSLFFYSWWNPFYITIFLSSIAINFYSSKLLLEQKSLLRRKVIVTGNIIFNVGLIAYYKYVDFIIYNFNNVFGTNYELLGIALPLAISFFTFQQIAYIVDCYRGKIKSPVILDYLLFISFFPQLIAGPIVQYTEIVPQLKSKLFAFKIDWDLFLQGLLLLSMGVAKKVLIADSFSIWANYGFGEGVQLSFLQAWITSLSYSFQLYFDFSGYTDMALGSALLFGIKLPENFNSPYRSLDIQDFWRRWHITLGRFLRDYLYIPLGGNRRGSWHTLLNLFLVFFIAGLWHGAGWTFVIWGLMHGAALIVHRAWTNFGYKMNKALAWVTVFLFVNTAWVIFRAQDIKQALYVLGRMVSPDTYFNASFYVPLAMIGTGLITCLCLPNSLEISKARYATRPYPVVVLSVIAFCGLLTIKIWNANEFLYFQF